MRFTLVFLVVIPAFAGVLPLFNPSYITKQSNSFYINLDTFLTNDLFTLKGLFNGSKTSSPHIRSGQNIAFGDIRTDIGYTNKKYGYLGYTYREEVLIVTNQDTAELYYLTRHKQNLPVGKHYNLDLSIKAFKVQGIEYAKSFDLYHDNGYVFNVGFGLEALQGKDMQDGTLHGSAVANSKKSYTYNIVSHYNYTHNYLYKLHVNKASAYGYSSDLSIYFKKDNFHLLLLANDIVGRLYWSHLPRSDVNIVSHKKDYRGQALISGYEGYKSYTQTLVAKYRAQLAYQHKKYLFKLGGDAMYGIYMPYIESDYMLTSDFSLGLGYETRFHSITLKSQYKKFAFNIQIGNIFKPSTLGLNISYLF